MSGRKARGRPKQTDEARFWSILGKYGRDADACWIWPGSKQANGTGPGCFAVKRPDGTWGMEGAHRTSWRVHKGAVPAGAEVWHTCNFLACVNPDHLELKKVE